MNSIEIVHVHYESPNNAKNPTKPLLIPQLTRTRNPLLTPTENPTTMAKSSYYYYGTFLSTNYMASPVYKNATIVWLGDICTFLCTEKHTTRTPTLPAVTEKVKNP